VHRPGAEGMDGAWKSVREIYIYIYGFMSARTENAWIPAPTTLPTTAAFDGLWRPQNPKIKGFMVFIYFSCRPGAKMQSVMALYDVGFVAFSGFTDSVLGSMLKGYNRV
jgi:hypothetical protein